jgi:Fic family protein
MRIPEAPPNRNNISISELVTEPTDIKMTDKDGRYLHWDEIRRRPSLDGLSHELLWAKTKLARAQNLKFLPFTDKDKQPFRYCEPDCIRRRLRWLDLNCGGAITTNHEQVSEQDTQLYLARSIAEEPISSSILEGAATTRAVARAMIEEKRVPRDRDERMVLNNYQAMQEVSELKGEKLTPELVLHIHKIITEGTLDDSNKAGVLRDKNDINVQDDFGEVLHNPPNAQELPERMSVLCAFANGSEEDEPYVHPLARAIILHFMLAYDHPFVDGNGRVARALFYWSALRSGYWLMKYVSISHILDKAPSQYGKAFLKVETDESDVTYFLDHQLGVLQVAIEELQAYIARQKQKFSAFEDLLSTGKNWRFKHRQTALLKDLLRKSKRQATIGEHQKRFNVSYLTARKDLEDLTTLGLLEKQKQGRQHLYFAAPDLVEQLASITAVKK